MLLGKERWAGDEPEQGSERQTRRPASGVFDMIEVLPPMGKYKYNI
jgi:hypothetical protein